MFFWLDLQEVCFDANVIASNYPNRSVDPNDSSGVERIFKWNRFVAKIKKSDYSFISPNKNEFEVFLIQIKNKTEYSAEKNHTFNRL